MLNNVFNSQVQTSMMKAMWSMLQSLMQQMEKVETQSSATTSSTATNDATAATSFASAMTKASSATSATQTKTLARTDSNYESLITSTASKYGVDANLVRAIVQAESNFNPKATSYVGAQGLMQLMPGTARSLGVSDPLDPQQNVDGGVRFLKGLLTRYNGNVEKAVAAYNAGPGAVDKYNGVPPYRETQTYVKRVLGLMGKSVS
jgi:soluble lytic murein transglycosylase-like protein